MLLTVRHLGCLNFLSPPVNDFREMHPVSYTHLYCLAKLELIVVVGIDRRRTRPVNSYDHWSLIREGLADCLTALSRVCRDNYREIRYCTVKGKVCLLYTSHY